MIKKNITIDDLAVMVQVGFKELSDKISGVDSRVDSLEEKMEKKFAVVDERFDRIEFLMGGHNRRIEILEDKMRLVQTKLKLS